MARPKKEKQDKELVSKPIEVQATEVVQAPIKKLKSTKEIQEALLLNYSKITLKRRGLI